MTIANTFASKLFVGFVAIAMALSLAAPAMAQTEAELQAQIDSLMSTINALQSQLGQAPAAGGSSASVCPYAWTRSLSNGATGADVMALQQFLNANVATQVAASGPGSAGMETQYYGGLTAAAVSNFQVTYRDEILTPVGLVNPTGYFGPSTMAKANALCSSAPADDTDDDDDTTDDDDDDVELSGEGTLGTFEVDDDESEVQEGEEDVTVMVITAEADDGDIEIDRMAFALTDPTTTGADENEEGDPWDVFEEVSLWVDGDKVAEFDASDEDEYLNEDNGTFRFSGLDLVLREGEETEIMVAVTVVGSVDGSDDTVNDAADWDLSVDSVRYFDADGVATDDSDVDEIGDSEVFEIVEEGTDDDASVEASTENPDATTLLVDDGSDESDEFVVHIFDIEVGEDSSDLVLDDAFVDVTLTNPAGAVTTTMGEVVADVYVTIDGEKVDGEATDILGSDDGDSDETEDGEIDHDIAATQTNTVRYRFEFDGLDLEADTDYEVEVSVVLEGTDDGAVYENSGVQITTEVDGAEWEVEGLAGDNILTDSDSSEDHTLATVVPVISDTSFEVDRNENGDAGTIFFDFTVEADGENDFFFEFGDITDVQTTGDGVVYTVTGPSSADYTAAITKTSGDATASSTEGWIIADGDEASFSVAFTFTSTSTAGAYRVNIDTVAGIEIDETSGALTLND